VGSTLRAELAQKGRIEDPDIYTDSVTAFWERVDEANVDVGSCWPALGPRGFILVVRRSGTLREGGGEYEMESLFSGSKGF
jgi:hypothetical protein